jgi:hypothetical protein
MDREYSELQSAFIIRWIVILLEVVSVYIWLMLYLPNSVKWFICIVYVSFLLWYVRYGHRKISDMDNIE